MNCYGNKNPTGYHKQALDETIGFFGTQGGVCFYSAKRSINGEVGEVSSLVKKNLMVE